MKISGHYTLNTNPDIVWNLLFDPEVLSRILPGVDEIEHLEDKKYKVISEVKIGPVRGRFSGDMELISHVEHEQMSVVIDQKSKIGNARATIDIQLENGAGQTTKITYHGEASLAGTLARMGQRIIGGVVSTLAKQVFQELEKELNNN
jgi:carbon monoxide dehydrogenase subunit G